MNYLVDTNFLLRLAQNTSPFQQYTRNAYSSLRSQGEVLMIVPQNLIEFWAVATRPVKLSFTAIYGIAFLNMGIGYCFISLGTAYPIVLLGLAIAGSGLGLLMPNMNFCLTSVTPDAMRGKILSGVTTSLFLGQFLSPVLSQPVSARLGLATTYASAGGFMLVLAAIALISLGNRKAKSS